jgi:hypothetical protein
MAIYRRGRFPPQRDSDRLGFGEDLIVNLRTLRTAAPLFAALATTSALAAPTVTVDGVTIDGAVIADRLAPRA